MIKRIVMLTNARKNGETKAHYYTRINKKVRKIKEDIIGCIVLVVIMVLMMMMFLFGDDGQCNYSACDCPGYECNYHCEQHGHDCPEND